MNDSGLLHIYQQHEQNLLKFLTKRVRCASVAADLAHDLYLKLRRLDAVASIRNAQAYLFQMAANLATDHLKIERRRAAIREEIAHFLWRPDGVRTPEQMLFARHEVEKLRKAINDLPSLSRKIFYLNRFEGMRQRQIATALGISTTTVETHIRKVLAHLQKTRES